MCMFECVCVCVCVCEREREKEGEEGERWIPSGQKKKVCETKWFLYMNTCFYVCAYVYGLCVIETKETEKVCVCEREREREREKEGVEGERWISRGKEKKYVGRNGCCI